MSKDLFLPVFLSSCLLVSGVGFAQKVDSSIVSDSMSTTSVSKTEVVQSAASVPTIVTLPPSMVVLADAGQVEAGTLKSTVLQRFSVWYTDKILINNRLQVNGGVGGLFFYASPTGSPGEQAGYKNGTFFGPGLSEADAKYSFGDVANPWSFLQFGYFPYKYNPDAMDLGEYLLRSQAYPNIIVTGDGGGWDFMSEANYMMLGVRFNLSLWDGKFRSDFLIPMERDYSPVGDFSPTYVGTLDPLPGIEIGAGVDCGHCISVAPRKTSPKVLPGTQQSPGNVWVVANPDRSDSAHPFISDTTAGGKPAGYYTFEGVKLEARASFDPKAYIPLPMLGKEDLKIFGEVAILGVKDYPFYYNDIYQRMPIMFGMNLPTFKLLDILSFQMEYFNSKFVNTTANLYDWETPIPIPEGQSIYGGVTNDPNAMLFSGRALEAQKWHWSVYAKKEIIRGISIYAQVADDHMRLPSYDQSYTFQDIGGGNGSDWYYLVRLQLGI